MSYWAHVCGCIRIDSLRLSENDIKKDSQRIEEVLGKIMQWDYEGDDYGKTKLPMGSEGSLEYSIIGNPDLSHLAAYVVAIWGDLRDYGEDIEDIQYIEDWFNNVCSEFIIRQAVLTITAGCLEEPKTITYNGI